jgi:tetratricopeptide (TPR) repeat protein
MICRMKPVSLVFVILLPFVAVAAQDQRQQLDALRAEGYEALYNLDYEGARKRFQKMIDLAPDHPAGVQCYASSLWLQQLNEAWELQATLYSTDAYEKGKPKLNRAEVEEFRKWIRTSKQLSQARLKKDPRDVEALYFLGAAEGLEAAFAGGVERKFRAALRSGTDAADHHKEVLKLSPEFRDAELTIGLLNYVIGSLSLPVKMLAATMGVRGSKKRGLEALERVAAEGKWARDGARVLLIDLYKREKRWTDAFEMARQLSEKYPRNYLFKLQMADARVSEILALRKNKTPVTASQEQQVSNIFASLLRDKTLDRKAVDLVNFRLNITRRQLKQP